MGFSCSIWGLVSLYCKQKLFLQLPQNPALVAYRRTVSHPFSAAWIRRRFVSWPSWAGLFIGLPCLILYGSPSYHLTMSFFFIKYFFTAIMKIINQVMFVCLRRRSMPDCVDPTALMVAPRYIYRSISSFQLWIYLYVYTCTYMYACLLSLSFFFLILLLYFLSKDRRIREHSKSW